MASRAALQRAGIVVLAVVVRALVGLSDYSGARTPPKYGDYEAQRHWMELTTNLPPTEWYVDSSINNASYWPLDYPPLSGYQSWIHGQFIKAYEPAAVELVKSHGYETPSSKTLLRLTVLLSDVLVYFPAAAACAAVFTQGAPPSHQTLTLAALLLNPALIIIDHGHFQYNCISLGLAAAAAAALGAGRQLLGSFLFSLSLNHKQMGLFFAPAFFAHLLGWALQHRGFGGKVFAVAKLGVMVLATFAICWAPCMRSPADALLILQRVFPIKRGLFEDYVANFWCASSVAIKWRNLLPQPTLLKLCAGTTLLVALPSMAQQIMRPSTKGLLFCMANSAMSFFMFSFQVHEKSILLPLLPITILAAYEPAVVLWAPLVASFSMYPLLYRDGVTIAYFATMFLYLAVIWPDAQRLVSVSVSGARRGTAARRARASAAAASNATGGGGSERAPGPGVVSSVLAWAKSRNELLGLVGLAGAGAMHVARVFIEPPPHLLWLHDRLFVTASFGFFALLGLYLQVQQWRVPAEPLAAGARPYKKVA